MYDCTFKHRIGMQKKWVESSRIFLDFVTRRHSQSTKVYLVAGESVATDVDENLLPKFNTEPHQKT